MFSDNICLWYDEAREEHDLYILECEAKEALDEFESLALAIEEYDLTDEQFDRLPDETFPEDGELRYMSWGELERLMDKANRCNDILKSILAEVSNH